MARPFDSHSIADFGWRQGAILGEKLMTLAGEHAPPSVVVDRADWLVLSSHDCDIVNASIEKEPVVEVLRMLLPPERWTSSGCRAETHERFSLRSVQVKPRSSCHVPPTIDGRCRETC